MKLQRTRDSVFAWPRCPARLLFFQLFSMCALIDLSFFDSIWFLLYSILSIIKWSFEASFILSDNKCLVPEIKFNRCLLLAEKGHIWVKISSSFQISGNTSSLVIDFEISRICHFTRSPRPSRITSNQFLASSKWTVLALKKLHKWISLEISPRLRSWA